MNVQSRSLQGQNKQRKQKSGKFLNKNNQKLQIKVIY